MPWLSLQRLGLFYDKNDFVGRRRSTLGLLMQGERIQQLERLRGVARRLTETPAPQATSAGDTTKKPGWLLLLFDVCCLAGVLLLTVNISWVYDRLPSGDPDEYHNYAMLFWNHVPHFHDFPKEYPPLSLIPFSLTLFPSDNVHFYWVFAGWMALLVCVSYVWLARVVSRKKALIYALYLVVGAMGTLLMRFDLWPALATLGALMLAERKHYTGAYALLAIGVLLKIYPGFLVPVVMAFQWRDYWGVPVALPGAGRAGRRLTRRERLAARWVALVGRSRAERRVLLAHLWQCAVPVFGGALLCVLVVALGFSVPASLNWQGTISTFRYNVIRPIQIESVPASLLWVGTFFGFPAHPNDSFVSLNLVGPLDVYLKSLSMYALVGGMLFVSWRVLRGKLTLGEAFVATIALVLVSNKLLSPQYLMWILPLVAYVEGFDLLWLVICALTTLIFPFIYQTRHPILAVPTNSAFLPTIALRNALLVIATVKAVRGGRARQDTKGDHREAEVHLERFSRAPAARKVPSVTLNASERASYEQPEWLLSSSL